MLRDEQVAELRKCQHLLQEQHNRFYDLYQKFGNDYHDKILKRLSNVINNIIDVCNNLLFTISLRPQITTSLSHSNLHYQQIIDAQIIEAYKLYYKLNNYNYVEPMLKSKRWKHCNFELQHMCDILSS